MSWYGTHGAITKEQAKELLPPRACRKCVYWVRVFIDFSTAAHPYYLDDTYLCPRCGALIKLKELQGQALDNGWIKRVR